ncbi:hypothetical protein FPCIR_3987 [Fusarium pseudocircinatum]|uniref:Uncharacterized protein n=1 Tax=Fusarium pseudocircinatum TaxID=56676 RepID=A0A8H5URC3_9HYPO|nr:hypothetical protein FPCIR_3987 [Fusarium pseudocircinatum]
MRTSGPESDTEGRETQLQRLTVQCVTYGNVLDSRYGNKKKLKKKLNDYFGDGSYEIVERSGNQWQIMVPRKLEEVGGSDFVYRL